MYIRDTDQVRLLSSSEWRSYKLHQYLKLWSMTYPLWQHHKHVLLYMGASLCLPFIFHSVSTAHVHCCLPDQYTERTSAHNHPINQRACQRVLPVGNSWDREGISIVPPFQERQADKQTDRQIHSQTQRLGRQVDKKMRQTRECRQTCLRGQPLLQFDTAQWTACV